jgi:Bacterial EndoU nuclease
VALGIAAGTALAAGVASSTVQAGGLILGAAGTGWGLGSGAYNITHGKPLTGALDIITGIAGIKGLQKGYAGYKSTRLDEQLGQLAKDTRATIGAIDELQSQATASRPEPLKSGNILENILDSRQARQGSGFRDFSERSSRTTNQAEVRARVESNIAESRIARGVDPSPADNSPLNITRLLKQFRLNDATSPITQHTLEHVFQGQINRRGKATGFHYEATGDATIGTGIRGGITSTPNINGVYQGRIAVQGVNKTSNEGVSTFFPKNYTRGDIVKSGLDAFKTRVHYDPTKPSAFTGVDSKGLVIEGHYRNGVIQTYYPVY